MESAAVEKSRLDTIRLEGLDCADCASKLEKRVQLIPGVEKVQVNFGASKMNVTHAVSVSEIINVISKMGYTGSLEGAATTQPVPFWKTNQYAISTTIAGIFLLLAIVMEYTGVPPLLTHSMYALCIVLGGFLPARSGLLMLLNAHELDMNALMAVAVIGAVAIGEFQEGAVVILLFSLGNALQANAMDKTRNSIRALMSLTPDKALVRRMGLEIVLPIAKIQVGDTVIVRPGERIPMDGQVLAGISSVNQSVITGESIPVIKQAGEEVYAGTINERGSLEVEVTKLVSDNTMTRIIHLVEEAQGQRAPSQQFIDRFAKYYTPSVILIAFLVAVIPPLLLKQPFEKWLYQALALLLVACPCALLISTPVSIVSAIGGAARKGVLIKGGIHLEQAGSLSVIAFDKTGTLTRGKPELTDLIALIGDEDELLSIAAAIESRSEHPLGEAILQYAKQRHLNIPAVTGFEAIVGRGAQGEVNGKIYYIGNMRFFAERNIPLPLAQLKELQHEGKTAMLISDEMQILGIIAVADVLRDNSHSAIEKLRRSGIKKVVMLTGDNEVTAHAIAEKAGVDDFTADLLPEDKVHAVKDLLARYGKVAMVGDGVNDAPAMAIATVGIAMGVAGTGTALETADITLMSDDLSKLAYTINLSRQTLRVMKQNISFSLLIKGFILLLVIPGWLTLWLAVIADMGTSLLVT
ncbi:MAG: heavy metal translocating P-type ATPase, partial [Syntrophomonas sp.]|nr:heavy metal translocating P-type ATPase [Syntrophomonas sp.]